MPEPAAASVPRDDPACLPCLACGYDLRGSEAVGRCPECGETIPEAVGVDRLALALGLPPDRLAGLAGTLALIAWMNGLALAGAILTSVSILLVPGDILLATGASSSIALLALANVGPAVAMTSLAILGRAASGLLRAGRRRGTRPGWPFEPATTVGIAAGGLVSIAIAWKLGGWSPAIAVVLVGGPAALLLALLVIVLWIEAIVGTIGTSAMTSTRRRVAAAATTAACWPIGGCLVCVVVLRVAHGLQAVPGVPDLVDEGGSGA